MNKLMIIALLTGSVMLSGCTNEYADFTSTGIVVSVQKVSSIKTANPDNVYLYVIRKNDPMCDSSNYHGDSVIFIKKWIRIYAPKEFANVSDTVGYTNGVYCVLQNN